MDLIDRLAEFLRALFSDADAGRGRDPGSREPRRPPSGDPDVNRAWEELDEYLGRERSREARGEGSGERYRRGDGRSRAGDASRPLESLRQDYANLEVAFGADIATVRRAYKRLILRYHPDRHAGNPEKLRVATEITQRINESFERLRSHLEEGGSR